MARLQRYAHICFRHSVVLILVAILFGSFESAPVTQIKTQAPGFYRHILGAFEITAILDGSFTFNTDTQMPNVPKDEIRQALEYAFVPVPAVGSITAFLINTNQHLVLIETGVGYLFGGQPLLQSNILAAGYHPDQIDYVFLTHLHADHYGGLAPNGTRAFKNAVLRISKTETDYFLNPANEANVPETVKKSFPKAAEVVNIYRAADKFQPFNAEDGELVPGIRPSVRFGHTPGHTHYFVESKGQTLVIIGDIVHLEPVQLPNPAATIIFDHNTTEAVRLREDLLGLAADKKYLVAAMHTAFPGIAHVRRSCGNRKGFEWIPIQYNTDLTIARSANFSF